MKLPYSLFCLLGTSALAPWSAEAQTVPLAAAPVAAPRPLLPPKIPPVLISELRASGPNGAQDFFVELFNTGTRPLPLMGYSLRFPSSKPGDGGATSVSIPPGTLIGARSHVLLVGKTYSLPHLTPGDATLEADLSRGVQLCDAGHQILDAVGPTGAALDFRLGAGLPAFAFALSSPAKTAKSAPIPQFSIVRKAVDGQPQNTGDNAQDFVIVSVTGRLEKQKTLLGTPGPENVASPRLRPPAPVPLVVPNGATPLVQAISLQTDPALNSMRRARRESGPAKTFGTMTLRCRLTNDTLVPLKNLWFRVNDITDESDPKTAPAQSAAIRLIRGKAAPAPDAKAPDAKAPDAKAPDAKKATETASTETKEPPVQRTLSVWKARLAPAPTLPLGGGLNSLLSVDLPEGGIAPGARGEVWFSFGVERRGDYRVVLGSSTMNIVFEGNTEDDIASGATGEGDFVPTRRNGMFSRSGGAAGNGNGQNGNAPGDSTTTVANVEERQEAEGLVIEGNTDDGVPTDPVPPTVVPSTKSS